MFRPMTEAIIRSITTALTRDEVRQDPAWINELTILVTSNFDKAVLTRCTSELFAKQRSDHVLRWRRSLKTDVPPALFPLIYDEDVNPELFAYFVVGAPANILDNNNGNVGWGVANGTRCRMHSVAWSDQDKTIEASLLIEQAAQRGNLLVDLPFPPDYINVTLLDEAGNGLSGISWPPANNLETNWLLSPSGEQICKSTVVIPIGIASSKGKKRIVRLGQGVLSTPYEVEYVQHGVDLGLVMTVWKAQGSTLKRVVLSLESASRHAPKWGYEHLYVGVSRVTAAQNLRCFPLSGAFRRSRLSGLFPNIFTTKWRLDCERTNTN